MTDVVNLEQLNYRDQLIKEYIDQHSGGGTGGSLWCELEVTQDHSANGPRGHLYMKCYKGTILETDELQFARQRATQTYRRWDEEDETWLNIKRKNGWIIPRNVNYINLYKVLDVEKSNASETYDYWEILPKNKSGQNSDWETFIDEFLRQRHDNIDSDLWYSVDSKECPMQGSHYFYNYACIFKKWGGIAIKRDGKIITNYKEFMLVGVNRDDRVGDTAPSYQLRSTFTTNGRYVKGCGPDESQSGNEEKVYCCGFLIKKQNPA